MKCLLCNENAVLKTESLKGYKAPDMFSVYHCTSCNTSFSTPRTDARSIYQLIYENRDKITGYDRYWKYLKEIKNHSKPIEYLANAEPSYWAPVHAIKNVLNVAKDAQILEAGSGLGYTTYAFRQDGYINIIGIDIAQDAVKNATKELGDYYVCTDVHEYTKTHANKYDVIFMTEVIEHIENPRGIITALLALLKEGGTLIMTTPNKSFFPDNTIWATDLPPVHYWWFSEDSFKYLAQELNTDISFVDFTDYHTNHRKELINAKQHDNISSNFIFGKGAEIKKVGFLPKWLKKTRFYSSVRYAYNLLLSSFSNDYIKSGKRMPVLCVLLTKKKS